MASKKAAAWSTQVDNEEDGTGETGLAPLPAAFAAPAEVYPSLGDAAKVVETKAEKKKKSIKMSISDFNSYTGKPSSSASGKFSVASARARSAAKGAEVRTEMLPTGPRMDRDAEETGPGLGGGFRDYGGNRGSAGGGFDREERPERRGFNDRDRDDRSQHSDDGPSRADAADSWGGASKFKPSSAADDRRDSNYSDRDSSRRGGFNERDRESSRVEDDGPSRADTSDNWGKNRVSLPDPEPQRGSDRRSGFGNGDGYERRDGDVMAGARADEASTWARRESSTAGGGGARGGDSWSGARRSDSNTGSVSEKRKPLVLSARTKPAPVIKVEAGPPQTVQQPEKAKEEELPPKPRAPRANPYGSGRSREEVLAAQNPPPPAIAAHGDESIKSDEPQAIGDSTEVPAQPKEAAESSADGGNEKQQGAEPQGDVQSTTEELLKVEISEDLKE